MKAEIIAVGTELLLGEIVNTNAAYLSSQLASLGVGVYYHTTVGDNMERLVDTLKKSALRSDLILITGGLGPTVDDITREAVANAFDRPLELDQASLEHIESRFSSMHRVMTPNNRRQAEFPRGARVVPNPVGTAPGLIVEIAEADRDSVIIACLPGVPSEMKAMMEETLISFIKEETHRRGESGIIHSRVLHFIGIGESALEDKLRDLMIMQINPTIAPYAGMGEVRLRITARADTEEQAAEMIGPVEKKILDLVGEHYYGRDEETLETAVAKALLEREFSIAVAESCTGGLIGHRITEVPGSSAYFDRGFLTYSNESKQELLGVKADTLSQYGAVSKQTAIEMAQGARRVAGATFGVSVTGIAGPGGGTDEKPVGLVYMAIDGPLGTWCEEKRFPGGRSMVKYRTSHAALDLIRRYALKTSPEKGD